jgi:hypothetical protein
MNGATIKLRTALAELGLTRVENDPSAYWEDQYHPRQWTRQCVFTDRLSRRVARG